MKKIKKRIEDDPVHDKSDNNLISNHHEEKEVSFEPDYFCTLCNSLKINKPYHCESCDVCIDDYDHHCPWIGKVVL
jgi:hypothetical protein